jgi:hypothetical protein
MIRTVPSGFPVAGAPILLVGPNVCGVSTPARPAVMTAQLTSSIAVVATKRAEAHLIHLSRTGHRNRMPVQEAALSPYQRFVTTAIERAIPPTSALSAQLYLETMLRVIDERGPWDHVTLTWDVSIGYQSFQVEPRAVRAWLAGREPILLKGVGQCMMSGGSIVVE